MEPYQPKPQASGYLEDLQEVLTHINPAYPVRTRQVAKRAFRIADLESNILLQNGLELRNLLVHAAQLILHFHNLHLAALPIALLGDFVLLLLPRRPQRPQHSP